MYSHSLLFLGSHRANRIDWQCLCPCGLRWHCFMEPSCTTDLEILVKGVLFGIAISNLVNLLDMIFII